MAPFLDKIFSPIVLILLNLAIIKAAEFVGGGKFFAETGLIHGIVLVFVFLILARIFSEYAFGDYILKGFLKIQMAFFLFLGFVHIYEYLGVDVLVIKDSVVELSVTLFYLLWLIGNLIALEFVFRIYEKKSFLKNSIFAGGFVLVSVGIIALHAFSGLVEELPSWTSDAILLAVVVLGVYSSLRILKIKEIMPIFNNFAIYTVPAIALVVLATFSEYSESVGFLSRFNISPTQNLYLSHFIIYAALSLLLIGFGKLKQPTGIYSEM
jgi:hypothetical protein